MSSSVQLLYALFLALLTFASAEFTSRFDDSLRRGIPLAATPDREHDLTVVDDHGIHGRPNGSFKKWKLNEWGFRSKPMLQRPASGIKRVMVLGASEAFGLYESKGGEFPAQLDNLISHRGDFEVINASVVGMTVSAMVVYWQVWAKQFKPDVVVIYASPLFYLSDTPPAIGRKPRPAPSDSDIPLKSRFVERVRDVFEMPQLIQRWRERRSINAVVRTKPDGWLFREVPQDRLDLFESHLEMLGSQIASTGARVLLCSHAVRVTAPLSDDDLEEFERGRIHIPRATAEIAAKFHTAANTRIEGLAHRKHWTFANAAADLSGNGAYFADLVHFSDSGAKRMAELLSTLLVPGPSATQ